MHPELDRPHISRHGDYMWKCCCTFRKGFGWTIKQAYDDWVKVSYAEIRKWEAFENPPVRWVGPEPDFRVVH